MIPGTRRYVASLLDITEWKKMEAVVKAEKVRIER